MPPGPHRPDDGGMILPDLLSRSIYKSHSLLSTAAHHRGLALRAGGSGSLVDAKYLSASADPGHLMSVENIIGLTGGVLLVLYLFVALTHPDWF